MTEIEVWRPVVGYEGLYEVSSMGKVKSLGNDKKKREKILKFSIGTFGYLKVNLYKEGKRKTFRVHRLVALAFIPNSEGLREINHKDEDKMNNVVDNLEWCDRMYNMNYGSRNERMVQTGISKGLYDPELCGIDKKERERLYYKKNRERILEYQQEYQRKNREKIREQQQEYYQKNRDRINEYKQEYRRKNREKNREYQRKWREKKKQGKKDNSPSEVSLW